MPLPDTDLLAFFSEHPIDKIVASGTHDVGNTGATVQAPQQAAIAADTLPNPYGRRAMARAVYSVDGGSNYQSMDSRLVYTFSLTIPAIPLTTTLNGLQAAMSIGCSDSLIYFRTASGYHGGVSDDGVTYTYTPINQTFNIKYALFEYD